MKLYNLKVRNGWSDASFIQLSKLQEKMLPTGNTLPESTYAAKHLIKSLGLDYEMIHAYHNDCFLYWGKYKKINEFPTSSE